jgi:hypothetical protein
MAQLRIRLSDPVSGTIIAKVIRDEAQVDMRLSYLSDAPRDLVEAVLVLLRGATEARCCWQDEPGEHRWLFRREGDEVRLGIVRFNDTFARLDDDRGELVFQTRCTLKRLASQVRGEMVQLRNRMGEAAYHERGAIPSPPSRWRSCNTPRHRPLSRWRLPSSRSWAKACGSP